MLSMCKLFVAENEFTGSSIAAFSGKSKFDEGDVEGTTDDECMLGFRECSILGDSVMGNEVGDSDDGINGLVPFISNSKGDKSGEATPRCGRSVVIKLGFLELLGDSVVVVVEIGIDEGNKVLLASGGSGVLGCLLAS
jgi:hypothetical protein